MNDELKVTWKKRSWLIASIVKACVPWGLKKKTGKFSQDIRHRGWYSKGAQVLKRYSVGFFPKELQLSLCWTCTTRLLQGQHLSLWNGGNTRLYGRISETLLEGLASVLRQLYWQMHLRCHSVHSNKRRPLQAWLFSPRSFRKFSDLTFQHNLWYIGIPD
jgi:hypothetical protein